MQSKFTRHLLMSMVIVSGLVLLGRETSAQQNFGCQNERVIWSEDFGTGTTPTSDPNVINLGYQATEPLSAEGVYRIINNTQQKPEWHNSSDHTGNTDGKMLVANGQAEAFYQKTIEDLNGFPEGIYSFSLWVMNVDQQGVCAPDPLLTVVHVFVEYLNDMNEWVGLQSSPYIAVPTPQTENPTWVNLGSYFNLANVGNFVPTKIRITLSDGTTGGCGNDFAADDFKFAQCPAGGPMPVTFANISAQQKNAGVNILWSTSQEINNDHFEVERSDDGISAWQIVASVPGAGSSQLQHSYKVFDAHPFAGLNVYRVKQVDRDGRASYSQQVSLRVNLSQLRVSVMTNPFRDNLTVQFRGTAQQVTSRLIDITGKQVARENWDISSGETLKQFNNISNLHSGIYILSIQTNNGEVLFNGKVLKQ